MNRISFTLLFGSALFAAGHSQSAPATPARSEIVQWSGQHGGSDTASTRVLRNADEWNAFWKQVERDRPRPLDVANEMAVAIFLGEKRTGGFGALLLGTRVEDGKLVIDYRETTPEPGMMVTQALTHPWVVAVMPRSDLPVVGRNVAPERQSNLREK